MQTQKTLLILLYLAFIVLGIYFLLGFFNNLHPFFDSLSNFRVHLLIILLPIMMVIPFFHKNKTYQLLYALLLIASGFYLSLLLKPFQTKTIPIEKTQHITQMQFNLNFRNKEMHRFITYIKENPIDIITLQEVSDEHREKLQELQVEGYGINFKKDYPFVERTKGIYPYQVYCEFRGVGGGAILSKHPINEERTVCIEEEGLLWAEVQLPEQSIYVASLHLHWPFPYRQQEQINIIRPVLSHIPKPTLISGDFNAVAWSDAVKKITQASDTNVVNGLRWSIELKEQLPLFPFMKLSIDHLLLSKELEVERIEVKEGLGSDHLPIISTIRY